MKPRLKHQLTIQEKQRVQQNYLQEQLVQEDDSLTTSRQHLNRGFPTGRGVLWQYHYHCMHYARLQHARLTVRAFENSRATTSLMTIFTSLKINKNKQ